MSAFQARLCAMCVAEMKGAIGLHAQLAVTRDVATALAATIAAQVDGVSTASTSALRLILDELPGLVDEQSALIRQARQGRVQ